MQTVQCDQTANSCTVKVPAPGAAIVYFSQDAQAAIASEAYSTYPTTVITKTKNTVTIDPSVLATSNGDSGKNRLNNKGGTSEGGTSGAAGLVAPGAAALFSVVAGLTVFFRVTFR